MGQAQATGQTLTVTGPANRWPSLPESEAPRRFGLVVFCRDEAEVVELEREKPVVVGRRPPSEVLVDDASVSRQHARFSIRGDDVIVEDLDSRNGTFFEGRRVTERTLQPGDRVEIGPASVVVAVSARAPTVPTDVGVVVENAAMKEMYALVDRLAARNVPVLIIGETGTGKEHLARALHERGSRQNGPFVAINCAAIPTTLAESTLFGHERGAFTGATNRSAGVFERASGGVLFLDEIGEMPLSVQPMLLRALETGRITPIGSAKEIAVDVRVVAATNRAIEPRAPGATFRPDLYYRLGTVILKVPPLRERRDEIPSLARLFLDEARRAFGEGPGELSPEALRVLEQHDWPGNIRELRQVLQRASLLGSGQRLLESDLSDLGLEPFAAQEEDAAEDEPKSLEEHLMQYEKRLIARALDRAQGNRSVAADLLCVPRRTFYRRLRLYGL